MRFEATPSEQALWSALRGKRLLGVAFKRQVPIGRFVVDFLAPSRHVVVEVDGGYRARRFHADARRDAWLRRAGYRVVRLEAEVVLRDLPAALARIAEELAGKAQRAPYSSRAQSLAQAFAHKGAVGRLGW